MKRRLHAVAPGAVLRFHTSPPQAQAQAQAGKHPQAADLTNHPVAVARPQLVVTGQCVIATCDRVDRTAETKAPVQRG